jgi:molybdopterin molybdotransferase
MLSADQSQRRHGRMRLEDANAWVDARALPLAAESVPLVVAAGRVLAGEVKAAMDLPPFDRAAADGFALRADETVGASVYNPLSFRLRSASADAGAGSAVPIESGAPLPAGADAVVRPEHAVPEAGAIAVIAPVFAGHEVERAGSHAARGSILVRAGRRLDAGAIGLLASAGCERIPVVARPRVRCLLAADRVGDARRPLAPGAVYEVNGSLLAALVARDGGVVVDHRRVPRDRAALGHALAPPGADLVLVAGGSGPGSGDCAAAALADAGELAWHGVALRPGETAGAGQTASGTPVFLLPGAPAACLWAYELIVGRAARRLAGLGSALPFAVEMLRTARKIVSEIGVVEVCPVRRTADGRVEPLAPLAEAGLVSAVEADGFVLVPETSEGYPEGAPLAVHLYSLRAVQGCPDIEPDLA